MRRAVLLAMLVLAAPSAAAADPARIVSERPVDGNGVELYRDRPEREWPRGPDGNIAMHTRALDLDNLLAAAD